MWGEDGLEVLQPPDGYVERGFIANKPFLAKYLNWILNFIQETLIGAEHNPLDGTHTDITADSVTTDTLNVDNGPINFDVAYGQWVVDADYKYEAAPTYTAKIGTSRWQFQSDPYAANVFDDTRFLDIGKSMGYGDDLWIDIDAIVASTRNSNNDTVLSACKLFLQKGNGTITAAFDWFLEERDITTSADSYTTLATGSFGNGTITAVVTDTTFSEVTLWSTDKTLIQGREYRLRISPSSTDAYGVALLGGTISYKPARILPA